VDDTQITPGEVDETVRKVLAHKRNVIVLDLSTPRGSRLPAIARMVQASPRGAMTLETIGQRADGVDATGSWSAPSACPRSRRS
jgi:hypothetical protein